MTEIDVEKLEKLRTGLEWIQEQVFMSSPVWNRRLKEMFALLPPKPEREVPTLLEATQRLWSKVQQAYMGNGVPCLWCGDASSHKGLCPMTDVFDAMAAERAKRNVMSGQAAEIADLAPEPEVPEGLGGPYFIEKHSPGPTWFVATAAGHAVATRIPTKALAERFARSWSAEELLRAIHHGLKWASEPRLFNYAKFIAAIDRYFEEAKA